MLSEWHTDVSQLSKECYLNLWDVLEKSKSLFLLLHRGRIWNCFYFTVCKKENIDYILGRRKKIHNESSQTLKHSSWRSGEISASWDTQNSTVYALEQAELIQKLELLWGLLSFVQEVNSICILRFFRI